MTRKTTNPETQKHSETKPVAAIYIGRRITVDHKIAFFWQFDGEDKPRGYTKKLTSALIGERWEFQADSNGSLHTGVGKTPKQLDVIGDADKIKEWTATDAANEQWEIGRRMERKLAARKTQFDEALRPLKEMLDKLHNHDDRAAFIQRVQSELWRR